jgi:hypothetical protein
VASKKESSIKTSPPASSERKRKSGTPQPNEAAARRGRVRDALAAVGSFAAVVASPPESGRAAQVDLEELRAALSSLREAFSASMLEAEGEQRAARKVLEAFAAERVNTIEALATRPDDLETLERAGKDLEIAAELLELVERSADAAVTQVSVATLAEQALRLAWTIRSREAMNVHIRPAAEDCSVSCDPHVVSRALAIALALVRETSPHSTSGVVVHTYVEADAGVLEVTSLSLGETTADAETPIVQARLLPRIDATDAVLRAATTASGIGLVIEPGRVVLRCPRAD